MSNYQLFKRGYLAARVRDDKTILSAYAAAIEYSAILVELSWYDFGSFMAFSH